MSKKKEKVSSREVERLNARIRNLEDQNDLLQATLAKIKAEAKRYEKLRTFNDVLNNLLRKYPNVKTVNIELDRKPSRFQRFLKDVLLRFKRGL